MQGQESAMMAPMVLPGADTAAGRGTMAIRSSKSAQGVGGGARVKS